MLNVKEISRDTSGVCDTSKPIDNLDTRETSQFPTAGLKSLLQNSDLLELLLKPLETSASEQPTLDSKKSPTHDLDDANLNFKSLFDIEILDECLESKLNKRSNLVRLKGFHYSEKISHVFEENTLGRKRSDGKLMSFTDEFIFLKAS